ncbi:hypothetical protein TIFTF001_053500, partial [Ficus carica]
MEPKERFVLAMKSRQEDGSLTAFVARKCSASILRDDALADIKVPKRRRDMERRVSSQVLDLQLRFVDDFDQLER